MNYRSKAALESVRAVLHADQKPNKITPKVRGRKPGKPLEFWINTSAELKAAKAACRELDRQIKRAQQTGQEGERLERLLISVRTKMEAA